MNGYADSPDDPSQSVDWEAQLRDRVLQQMQGTEPHVDPTPAAEPSTTSPDFNTAASPAYTDAPAAPLAQGAPDTPAPGNDANQIQGWASQWLGRTFSDADIAALQGQPLALVMHNIANSDEAKAYAARNAKGAGSLAPTGGGNGGGSGLNFPVQTGNAYGLSNGYATPQSVGDPNQAWKDSIRQIIMNRLQADQGPVDDNAPNIQAALNASKDAYTRQNTEERDALAERLYAQGSGLNTDAITQQVQQSNERTGTARSSLRAQLLMSAYKDRATELNHLLDLATQSGDSESARQIQLTLANLQAAVQRENIGANLSEFGATLNQNAALAGLQ